MVIDWERHHEEARQFGAVTQSTSATCADLALVGDRYHGPILVRLDGAATRIEAEIELAAGYGVHDILPPMINNFGKLCAHSKWSMTALVSVR